MIILTPQDPSDFQYSMAVTQDREARLDAAVRRVFERIYGLPAYEVALLIMRPGGTFYDYEILQIRKEFARG